MKYIDEFRDGDLARRLARNLHAEVDPRRRYRFMEFCGGHTHALSRHGLIDLLPPQVRMIHGPGCPVCVLPIGRVDQAICMARAHRVTLCAYGDCLRVPASGRSSLARAKVEGADIRMVYSTEEALALARRHPEKPVVFFAIGFETTTPPTAVVIEQAAAEGRDNFSVLCCHVLTPAAIAGILDAPGKPELEGIIGPAHVSTIIGSAPYEFVPERYGKPLVIAGFEPLDMLQAILMLIRQVNAGCARVENEFTRAVSREGNRKARALVEKIFVRRPAFEWRGLGSLPDSALRIRPEYARFDAELRHPTPYVPVPDHRACECPAILRGAKEPRDCKAFAIACTPESPLGACMVSAEGACAAHYVYRRQETAES
ncbi:MAG: hydrogenase formation protein HypD [Zoogloeaceae bacterium]|jgi:hydrogenase expression/formation protein HypD|nr:hydrogenase formation protein HypD [Zoogloeaceae bacterium]